MTVVVRVALCFTALFLLVCCASPRETAESLSSADNRPNILLIAVDDLNTAVGAWGGEAITPNIDHLAAQGVQFLNAYTAVPVCNPSRVAVMTGLRPEMTGVYSDSVNFRTRAGGASRVTIPQFFRQQGYQTAAAGKVFHQARGRGVIPAPMSDPISWDQQAETSAGIPGLSAYLDDEGWAGWLAGESRGGGLEIDSHLRRNGVWGPIEQSDEDTSDFASANYCADYLSQAHLRPFVLACGISRPRLPLLAPKKYFDLYPLAGVRLPKTPAKDMEDIPDSAKTNWTSGFARAINQRPDEWRRARQGYLASVSFADAMVGHILRALKESTYANNTIVVFWSDDGFHLGEKDRWGKFSLWRQSTHVPMVIVAPGIAPAKVRAAVSLLDIYPTLAELSGNEAPEGLAGRSLYTLVKQPDTRDWPHPAVVSLGRGNSAVIFGDWHLIQYADGGQELYNYVNDPEEYTNLINNPLYSELAEAMEKWVPGLDSP